ncbi:MAG: bacillithiol biosynthesis cysteine-adding enzyme BshC [Terriglobales bacterium]|jgi:bacillithiol biosynthesis cysteine-adding enzyme BshC
MNAECIPFDKLPHPSKLFDDFLSGKLKSFYPHSVRFGEWCADEAKRIKYDASRRKSVADVLEAQNSSWGASSKSIENIGRLRAGACAVVTGQQAGLFGGPLFSILKAITAIKLAEEARQKRVDAVPIFWLATEDHDFAEVNHVAVVEKHHLRRLELSAGGVEGAPVGARPLGKDVEAAVSAFAEALGDSNATELIRSFYRPGETLGSAMAKLFAELFGDYGLILLDPLNTQLHRIASPVLVDSIKHSEELDHKLLQRGKELEAAGYSQQVKVTDSSTLLFSLESGARVPIKRANGKFTIGKESVSAADLEKRIAQAPEKFSANVLLRPVMQDFLLPTLTYVGGQAEIAYFAQCEVVYKTLLGRVTPILPRCSATLIEERQQKVMEKFSLGLMEMFQGPERLKKLIAARVLPADLQSDFHKATENLDSSLEPIMHTLQKLDPTLAEAAKRSASKMRYQLDRLRNLAVKAELGRNEAIARKSEELSAALFPNGTLQEREIAGVSYLARHGMALIAKLHDVLQTSCPGHQIVKL